jgi:carboxymethylenebutenolidase
MRDLDPEVWKLFDDYVHGDLDRRGFLERAAKYCAGGLTAAGLLALLSPDFARAQKVPPDDGRLVATRVEVTASLRGLLVEPKQPAGKLPGVLVIHENRGLNPHIEDVARRVALEGFVALAPDALTPLGGYPGTEDEARPLFGKLDQAKVKEEFVAAAGWLKQQPRCTGTIGVVGFCWGGMMASWLATRLPDLGAAVAFYGSAPTAEETARIKAPMMIHYAEKDARINAATPAFYAALMNAGVRHQVFWYGDTQHGFHNDTTPRHKEDAAKLAWERTIAFFNQELRK